MSKTAKHESATPATEWLRRNKVPFGEHSYEYVEHGGTSVSSAALGVDHHSMIKTLIMEDENKKPLVILMHGDREVSTKNLARQCGRKSIAPCKPEQAQRNSGYQVGGTSPFGTRKAMPVYPDDLHQRRTPRIHCFHPEPRACRSPQGNPRSGRH